jgi:hypothetical protein
LGKIDKSARTALIHWVTVNVVCFATSLLSSIVNSVLPDLIDFGKRTAESDIIILLSSPPNEEAAWID